MPKIKQDLSKISHPNSRKTAATLKQIKRKQGRQKTKLTHMCLQNLIGEKLMWFKDRLITDIPIYNAEQTENIIVEYMARFNETLEEISAKHSIGHRKNNRQHANKEDVIKLTIKREKEEFETCGLEVPSLMDKEQLELLRMWPGEMKYLQKFKLSRVTRKFLEERKQKDRLCNGSNSNASTENVDSKNNSLPSSMDCE